MSRPATPLLDRVNLPADLRNFSPEQLRQLADELRAETIDAVSVTGGHLGSALGVVELTVALHAIFDTPHDRLLWDVGHQAYPHKILTGRRDRIRTLRQGGGLSGFTRRSESDIRSVRRGAFLHLHLRRARHGGGARSEGRARGKGRPQRHRRDRRRRDERGHGLRGDEQCRRPPHPPDRRAERQRHVDRAAGGRDERLSVAADVVAQLPRLARARHQDGQALPARDRAHRAPRRGIRPRHPDRRHLVRGTGLLLRRPDRRA